MEVRFCQTSSTAGTSLQDFRLSSVLLMCWDAPDHIKEMSAKEGDAASVHCCLRLQFDSSRLDSRVNWESFNSGLIRENSQDMHEAVELAHDFLNELSSSVFWRSKQGVEDCAGIIGIGVRGSSVNNVFRLGP